MFFEAHLEGRIGYKELTVVDLGRGQGNTTHIGLFDDILTFLPNHYEGSSMFIYEDECMLLDLYFDRIENPNGGFRSPKIKKGGRNAISVVTVIQDIANRLPSDLKWYLAWFGLKSEESIFILFSENSEHYNVISTKIDLTENNVKGRIENTHSNFNSLIKYLEIIVNKNGALIIEELEIISQTGGNTKYRTFDIEQANRLFSEIGKAGETFVAQYLDRLKYSGNITNYLWVNEDGESALPYDFKVQDLSQNIIHIDVKSTSYKFEQPMIFSNQEIGFANEIPYYHIYRVYNLSEEIKHLRICENSKEFFPNIEGCISNFKTSLNEYTVGLQTAKLTVSTLSDNLLFRSEINL